MAYPLLCIGHPLLDIQIRNGETLLQKYGLKSNDGILAGERHAELCVLPYTRMTLRVLRNMAIRYTEIVNNYEVQYVAGGAAQNTARGAQVPNCYGRVQSPSCLRGRSTVHFTTRFRDICWICRR
jgi:adenosine kinase